MNDQSAKDPSELSNDQVDERIEHRQPMPRRSSKRSAEAVPVPALGLGTGNKSRSPLREPWEPCPDSRLFWNFSSVRMTCLR